MVTDRYAIFFLPAIIRSEHDSALDALVALDLPRDEAMDLTVAAWGGAEGAGLAILASVNGGRPVAAVPLPGGRWAACNVYVEHAAQNRNEAGRRLQKLLRRGRRGIVAEFRSPFPA